MKFAAIDIGTNAVRLLIKEVKINGGAYDVRKVSFTRVPLRLGEDVFETGKIYNVEYEFVCKDGTLLPVLLSAISETGAENVYVTHGYTEIFTRYLNEKGWNAQVLKTEFGADEAEEEPAA